MRYDAYIPTEERLDEHYKCSNGLSLWRARYPKTVSYGYNELPYPYPGGDFAKGRILQRSRPMGDRVVDLKWENHDKAENTGNGQRWRDRHKTKEIVFSPYYNGRVDVVAKPGVNIVDRGYDPVWIYITVGRDGNIYYNGVEAQSITGGWARIGIAYTRVYYDEVQYNSIPDWVKPSPFFTFEVDSGVVTECLAKANSGTYDVLTEVAELPETLRYLFGLIRSAIGIVKNFKQKMAELKKRWARENWPERRVADATASLWLQWRYAIGPILYSIEDIKKTLEQMGRVFAKFKARQVIDVSMPDQGDYKFSGSATADHRCLIKRSYSPENLIESLIDVLGLNPIATAWELTTLSFVVDWFVNIGDLITAISGHDSSDDANCTYSVKTTVRGSYVNSNDHKITLNVTSYKRIVIDPYAHLGLSLNFDLTFKQKLDAIALLWGPISMKLRSLK